MMRPRRSGPLISHLEHLHHNMILRPSQAPRRKPAMVPRARSRNVWQERDGCVIDRVGEAAFGIVEERHVDQYAGGAHGLVGATELRRDVGAFVRVGQSGIPSRSISSGVRRSKAFQASNSATDMVMGDTTTPAICHVRSAARLVIARSSFWSTRSSKTRQSTSESSVASPRAYEPKRRISATLGPNRSRTPARNA